MFLEGQLTPTDPPPTADRCLQTICFLAGQLTVYTDGSATAGTKDGGAGVIVTCGAPADPTILHRSHLRGATFSTSFTEEAAAIQLTLKWATANHPESPLTICNTLNPALTQHSTGSDNEVEPQATSSQASQPKQPLQPLPTERT